jgi:hypothetical protein
MKTQDFIIKIQGLIFLIALIFISNSYAKKTDTKQVIEDTTPKAASDYINYIKGHVDYIYDYNLFNGTDLTFDNFTKIVKSGYYYALTDVNEDEIKISFNFFKNEDGKLDRKAFTRFYALNYLEGELMFEEVHPNLRFLNFRHNVSLVKQKGNDVAIEYWKHILKRVDLIFIANSLDEGNLLDNQQLYKILNNSKYFKTLSNKKSEETMKAISTKFFEYFDKNRELSIRKSNFKLLYSLFYWMEKELNLVE